MLKFTLLLWLLISPVQTDTTELTDFYVQVNKTHFDGRLKHACIHFVKGLLDERGDEARVYAENPPCYYVIEIDEIMIPLTKDSKMDVLHETCHIAVKSGGHGPKWQACMHRLAREGAFDKLW